MRRSLVVTLITATVAMACKDSRTPADSAGAAGGQTTAASATPAPASGGVTIASPTEGATTGTDVTVTLRAQGVQIAKADGAKVEGVGHYHLFLDTIPTADNTPIPPNSAKIVHIGSGDSSYTFKALTPGPHRIIAVIGYGDHSPMSAARDTVTFVVKK
jgi:hypothetical protein